MKHWFDRVNLASVVLNTFYNIQPCYITVEILNCRDIINDEDEIVKLVVSETGSMIR